MPKIKITLIKSLIDATKNQKGNIQGLGLGKLKSTVIHEDTPQIVGMINKVDHLVKTEKIS